MAEASESKSLIALETVSKTYPNGDVQALKSISLTIGEGEFVSIMGPSGCGKSTMLHMLGGLDVPDSGTVLFRGSPLSQIGSLDHFRSKEIGFVFQSFYLLPNLTAIENIQLPMFGTELSPSQRTDHAGQLLALLGLSDRAKHLPSQLSIGQRQRIAIARSLANNPSVLLADEPTGSLDSQSGGEVMDALRMLNESKQTTIVLVTHDARVAACGSRLIELLDGQVVADRAVSTTELSEMLTAKNS